MACSQLCQPNVAVPAAPTPSLVCATAQQVGLQQALHSCRRKALICTWFWCVGVVFVPVLLCGACVESSAAPLPFLRCAHNNQRVFVCCHGSTGHPTPVLWSRTAALRCLVCIVCPSVQLFMGMRRLPFLSKFVTRTCPLCCSIQHPAAATNQQQPYSWDGLYALR